MATFVCTEVNTSTNACVTWSEQVGFLPPLTAEQGLEVGSLVMLCMAVAWGVRFLVSFTLNRR
jgi:hypothetical protein